jgi:hypothetical protein
MGAALMTMGTLPAVAQDKPGVVMADLIMATATVEVVDHAKRTVTLKGPEGRTRPLRVDKTVRNFDQVQQGDQVVYTTAADNSLTPKTCYNVPLTPSSVGALPWYQPSFSTNSVSWRWCASS